MGRKQDKSWKSKGDRVYVGHSVHDDIVYIGGAYYESSAQIHLTKKDAEWLMKNLPKALKRCEGGK